MKYEQIKNLINTIQHPVAFLEFAKKYLEPTAKAGSSRIVYDIGKNRAIKIALNEAGIDQNKVEYSYGTSPTYSRYIPKSLSKNPNYFWIEVEKADLIKNRDEHNMLNIIVRIYEMMGPFTQNNLWKIIEDKKVDLGDERGRVKISELEDIKQIAKNIVFNSNFVELANFVISNMIFDDFHASNIGKVNGKYKFIDPGYNENVKKNYNSNRVGYLHPSTISMINIDRQAQDAANKKPTIVKEQSGKKLSYEQIKNIINTIQHPVAFLEFAKKYLEPTAEAGSSRIVHDIGNNKVIKIAFSEAGIDQNKVEYSYGESPEYQKYVPKSISKNPNYFWIEVEKADLIKNEDEKSIINVIVEFYMNSGRPFAKNDLWKKMENSKLYIDRKRPDVKLSEIPSLEKIAKDIVLNSNFVELANFVISNMNSADFHSLNIGKIDGKYKFIDTGFNKEVEKKYRAPMPGYFDQSSVKTRNIDRQAQKAADQKQTIVKEQKNKNLSFDEVKKIMKSIKNPRSMMAFLKRFGDKIGVGSSRAAFDIGNGRVLKIAFNEAGRWQNLNELKSIEKLAPYTPEIYEYHPDGFWIEMERALNDNDAIFYPKMIEFINLPNEVDTISDVKAIFYYLAPLAARLKSDNLKDYEKLILDTVLQKMVRPFLKRADFFLPFLYKLKETGTGDTNHKNMGFSLQKNIPVILDFGFASNAEKDLKSIYDRKRQVLDFESEMPEFFSTEKYFSDIESDNLKYKLSKDPSFVSEQNNNPYSRKDHINFGEEELKKIIKSFGTVTGLVTFISKFFPKAGKGASRVVFDLRDGSVLKIAANRSGIIQNKDEVDIYNKIKDPNVVASIYDYDKNGFKWIQMEKLIPASNLGDPIYKELFLDISSFLLDRGNVVGLINNYENIIFDLKSIKNINKTNLVEILIPLLKAGGGATDFNSQNVGYNAKTKKFKVIDAGWGNEFVNLDINFMVDAMNNYFTASKEIDKKIKVDEYYYDNISAKQFLNEVHGSIVDRVMRLMKDPSIELSKKRDWLYENLEILGSGIERVAFAIDEDYVLKVSNKYHADNFEEGNAVYGIQSFFEADPDMHAFLGELVPRIYDFDREDGNWILVERGVPVIDIRGEKKWMADVGIPTEIVQKMNLSDIGEAIESLRSLLSGGYDLSEAIEDIAYDYDLDEELIVQMLETPFILKMYEGHSKYNLGLEDFGYGNIGYGSDGRPVLLDVGFES